MSASVSLASTRAEIGKARAVIDYDELAETLVDHGTAVQAQQFGRGQVGLQNPPLPVPEEIGNRGEIEEVAVPLRRLRAAAWARCNSSFCISNSILCTCNS